jgi:type VI secretion system protein ImpC
MDRVRLTYSTIENKEAELPFRILVLGDFSAADDQRATAEPEPILVDATNFDEVMASYQIAFQERLPNHLVNPTETSVDVNIPLKRLDDFLPDVLLRKVPAMDTLVQLKAGLTAIRNGRKTITELRNSFDTITEDDWRHLGLQTDSVDATIVDLAIAEITQRLSKQLDEILHHPRFQELESAWRGLRFLVNQLIIGENCDITIVNTNKPSLLNDLENCGDVIDSFLYRILYLDELGSYGGSPYSVVVAAYHFGIENDDQKLLRLCSQISQLAFAPMITAACPSLLKLHDFAELPSTGSLAHLFEYGSKNETWRAFKKSDAARYVGLTLPSFLLRTAYDYQRDPIRLLNYQESPISLWGNAAYAFASCMLNSFIKYRWYMDVVSEEGGGVPLLSRWQTNVVSTKQPMMPLTVLLTERCEAELAANGFIPLCYNQRKNAVGFHSANSAYVGVDTFQSESQPKSLDEQIAAQLPYLFITCRLAHYLKVIQRDNIGTSKTSREIEDELNAWLVRYVSDMANPIPEVKIRRPLRKASLTVTENPDNKTVYDMRLSITPHFRYLGAAFSLSLEGHL